MKKSMKLLALLLALGTTGKAEASLVYVPSTFTPSSAKLLVVIHGCLQSAEAMALGAGWNHVAESANMVVLYPQVPAGTNPLDCWSWYLPENQKPGSGQLALLFREIAATKKRLKLKSPDTYLAGISSGGATVAGLLACFPEAFRAGAVHSGPSYGLARSLEAAEKVLREGPPAGPTEAPCRPSKFRGSLLVIQGAADLVVNPAHGARLIADFTGATEPVSTRKENAGGLSYSVSDYGSPGAIRGRLVAVEGLGHAWSGAGEEPPGLPPSPGRKMPFKLPFFSETGPGATRLMWEFFQQATK